MYDTSKPYKAKIKEIIKTTWKHSPVCQVIDGMYPLVKATHGCAYEIDHTDGIGSKGLLHWRARSFYNAAVDALAMNLNDLTVARAIPYKMQNHLIVPEDDHIAITDLIMYLSVLAEPYKIVMTGGETSVQNTLAGMELSLTMTGYVEEQHVGFQNRFPSKADLVAIPSNGLHANGFTKVREIFDEDEWGLMDFTNATKIYDLSSVYHLIHGACHIAGGGYQRLAALVESQTYLLPNPDMPAIFYHIYNRGVSDQEMYSTFNCGWGMILSVPTEHVNEVCDRVGGVKCGWSSDAVGKLLYINSSFSEEALAIYG